MNYLNLYQIFITNSCIFLAQGVKFFDSEFIIGVVWYGFEQIKWSFENRALIQNFVKRFWLRNKLPLINVSPQELKQYEYDTNFDYFVYFHSSDCVFCNKLETTIDNLSQRISYAYWFKNLKKSGLTESLIFENIRRLYSFLLYLQMIKIYNSESQLKFKLANYFKPYGKVQKTISNQ